MGRRARVAQRLLFVLAVLAVACAAAPVPLDGRAGILGPALGSAVNGGSAAGTRAEAYGGDAAGTPAGPDGGDAAGTSSNTAGGASQTPSPPPTPTSTLLLLPTLVFPLPPPDSQSLTQITLLSTQPGFDVGTITSTSTMSGQPTSSGTATAAAASASSTSAPPAAPKSQSTVIGLGVAGGVAALGVVGFVIWRCLRKRANRSRSGNSWSDHRDAAFQTPLPPGSNIGQGENSKALAAARRAVLDTRSRDMQEHGALSVLVTSRQPGELPAASEASVAEPILAPAGALERDPYYYRLAAEMQRLHAEYASGAPPTYTCDSGSEAAPAGTEDAAPQPPAHRKTLSRGAAASSNFPWRLDAK
jgi:hypothetical protein